MSFNFPSSPALNDTYTFGGRSWQWNGSAWDSITAAYGPQGAQGVQGLKGNQETGKFNQPEIIDQPLQEPIQ